MTEEAPDEFCEDCERMEEEIDELSSTLKRVQADYVNFKRRTEQQQQSVRKQAAKSLISDVLGVLDNLELALNQASEQSDFYKGVELIYGQLITVLEEHGVERVPEDDFDPNYHEAVLREASDEPKGSIIEVLQPGYKLGEAVLRTAKVKVSAGEDHE